MKSIFLFFVFYIYLLADGGGAFIYYSCYESGNYKIKTPYCEVNTLSCSKNSLNGGSFYVKSWDKSDLEKLKQYQLVKFSCFSDGLCNMYISNETCY